MQSQKIPVDRRLVRWLSFLSARTRERMEELVKGDTVMEKAMTTLEFLSQDRQTRMLYEERQKGLHDYVSAIEVATEKGKLEGNLEGKLNMERNGLYTPEIHTFTTAHALQEKLNSRGNESQTTLLPFAFPATGKSDSRTYIKENKEPSSITAR